MDISADHAYDASAADVFAMLTDEKFLAAKVAELSQGPSEVVECTATGDGWRIVTRRTVDVDVPGFAAKFLPSKNTVLQTDEWGPERDGVREGVWKVDAKGVPVEMKGTMRLVPSASGCVEEIRGRIKAGVPLVGGKLEHLVGDGVGDQLEREHEFALAWLAR
jgi:hypothetical protein